MAPGKIALNGGSNGGKSISLPQVLTRSHYFSGLLVVASINRAPPGTFGAGIAEVPVLDMLRVRLSLALPICLVLIVLVSLFSSTNSPVVGITI